MRIEHKVVPIYEVPEAGTRCHVYILDLYISKLPSLAFERDLQMISGAEAKPSPEPWFSIEETPFRKW